MKIGIISDTHGSLAAWQCAFNRFFSTADLIIHCGDVLYHGPRNPLPEGYDPAGLAAALNELTVPILFAKGNCDAEVDQMVLKHPIEAPYIHCYLPDLRILVHHGHLFTPDSLPAPTTAAYNLVISGHTHLPEITHTAGATWLNPGSPSLPKTADKEPSIALLENRHLRIIQLRTEKTIAEALL